MKYRIKKVNLRHNGRLHLKNSIIEILSEEDLSELQTLIEEGILEKVEIKEIVEEEPSEETEVNKDKKKKKDKKNE
jgi:hypothetical protein